MILWIYGIMYDKLNSPVPLHVFSVATKKFNITYVTLISIGQYWSRNYHTMSFKISVCTFSYGKREALNIWEKVRPLLVFLIGTIFRLKTHCRHSMLFFNKCVYWLYTLYPTYFSSNVFLQNVLTLTLIHAHLRKFK